MSFRNISWKTGDWIDVTRMNQFVENTDFIVACFDNIMIHNNHNRVNAFGVSTEQFYLKIDGIQAGPTITGTTENNVWAEYSNMNIDISSLSAGTHSIVPHQGTDQTAITYYKSQATSYISYWVTIGSKDEVPFRINLSILGHSELLPT